MFSAIDEMIERAKAHLLVAVADTGSFKTSFRVVDGLRFESDYYPDYGRFVPRVLEDPYILVSREMPGVEELYPIVTAARSAQRSVVLVTEDIDDHALESFNRLHEQGVGSLFAVRAGNFRKHRDDVVDYVAGLAGQTAEKGTFALERLGRAKWVVFDENQCAMIEPAGNRAVMHQRYKHIYQDPTLSTIENDVALITVGGLTKSRRYDNFHSLSNALRASDDKAGRDRSIFELSHPEPVHGAGGRVRDLIANRISSVSRSGPNLASPGVGAGGDSSPSGDVPVPPPPGPVPDTSAPEGTSIVRYPKFTDNGPAHPGENLFIEIDLRYDPSSKLPTGDQVQVTGLPKDWSEFPVTVKLAADHLTFKEGAEQGEILVRRAKQSKPYSVLAVVNQNVGVLEKLEINASFSYNERTCGFARHFISLAHNDSTPSDASSPAPEVAKANDERPIATILPAAKAPQLTVKIFHVKNSPDEFWNLDVADRHKIKNLPKKLNERVSLDGDRQAMVQPLYDQLAGIGQGDYLGLIQGFGDAIYQFTPDVFKKTYWVLRRQFGNSFPIQFITEDTRIPWELMRPVSEDESEKGEVLAMEHPVAHWIIDYAGDLSPTLPATGQILTIVPHYSEESTNGRLPWAQIESTSLAATFGNRLDRQPGTKEALMSVLKCVFEREPAGGVCVLHFAGHGEFRLSEEADSRLILEHDEILRVLEVRNIDTTLGKKYGTFVVLNACQIGGGGEILGTVGSWAEAFVFRKFRGFVAPLWAVQDKAAESVVVTLLNATLNDSQQTVAEALRNIKRDNGKSCATYLAYLYYGDVMATFGNSTPS
jgi:hypothetical protein